MISIGKAGFPPFFSLSLLNYHTGAWEKRKEETDEMRRRVTASHRPLKPGVAPWFVLFTVFYLLISFCHNTRSCASAGYKFLFHFFTWMGRPNSSRTKTVTSTFLLDDFPPRSKSPRSITKYKSFLQASKHANVC